MAEQAEQGKTKAELFRPLCAQGPYPPGEMMYGTMLIEALPVISGGTVKRQEV